VLPEELQNHGAVCAPNLPGTQDLALGRAVLQYHWLPFVQVSLRKNPTAVNGFPAIGNIRKNVVAT
jgi:hypothetical protein